MSTDLQQQFVRDMLTESYEGLDRYDQAILSVESGAATPDTLNDIFRVIHTLKGTAGCLGFHQIEKLAHAGENLLDPMRNGEIKPSTAIANSLLRLSDSLRQLLAAIETGGTDQDGADRAPLIAELHDLRQGRTPGASTAPAPSLPTAAADGSWGLFDDAPVITTPATPAPASETSAEAGWGLFDDAVGVPAAAAAPAPVPAPAAKPAPTVKAEVAVPVANASVRVDVGLLDRLMNLVGELVLSRNQLVQLAQSRTLRLEAVAEVSQRLNLVTTDLQDGVMKTRMQPIGNVWGKFPRIVRDIARDLAKQVRLETIGSETELDRTIIESIRDPLTHIIRNSIDHGIETPAQRTAAGKPAEGEIIMRAYHEGGQVIIEIIDDGAGINLARVRQKAVEKGLVKAEEAQRMGDREAVNLIFLPGFSTAEKITNVSGRGVGMDVVKTNIEKIGGSVEIQSTQGQGTTLRIKIPLTLAIVPALIVRAAEARFAIPQVNLLELVRLEGQAAQDAREAVHGVPVFRLRGQLYPLLTLRSELRLPPAPEGGVLQIIVLKADERVFGLVVDGVQDTQEIVVKPLGRQLKGLPMYAGATIMGDGKVALILDIVGLAQHARVLNGSTDRARSAVTAAVAAASTGPTTRLLLFSLPGRERLAMRLDHASRLEEIAATAVELCGNREAVQYRGRILPLVRLARTLAGAAPAEGKAETLQVIVCQQAQQSVGLVVGEIQDIVEEEVVIQPGTSANGLVGSAVINGRITDLVDVPAVLRASGINLTQAA